MYTRRKQLRRIIKYRFLPRSVNVTVFFYFHKHRDIVCGRLLMLKIRVIGKKKKIYQKQPTPTPLQLFVNNRKFVTRAIVMKPRREYEKRKTYRKCSRFLCRFTQHLRTTRTINLTIVRRCFSTCIYVFLFNFTLFWRGPCTTVKRPTDVAATKLYRSNKIFT